MGEKGDHCDWVRGFLKSLHAPHAPDVFNHVSECTACQAVFEDHPEALDAIFPAPVPLPSVKALAEANQRLNRPHPTTAPETSRLLPTPFAPGFILDQPIIRNQKTQVFRAKQAGLDRQVVVKFITCTSSLFDYQLLAREGNILGSLKHQHIVTLFQTGR